MPRLYTPTVPPGRLALKFRYNPGFIAAIKQVPGCSWDADQRCWWVPEELGNALLAAGAKFNCQPELDLAPVRKRGKPMKIESYSIRGSSLRPFQVESVNRALAAPGGRYLLGHEMGVGKSAPALAAAVVMGCKAPLVLTYASIRNDWVDHFEKWTDYEVAVLETGAEALDFSGGAAIMSYELLQSLGHPESFDAVIFDEAHALKNPKSTRNKYATELLKTAPLKLVLGLSGTLIPNRFIDIHGIVDLLWPGRFGTQFQFKKCYGIAEEDEYAASGFVYRRLNPAFEDELSRRLKHVSHRLTFAEAAPELPPFDVRVESRRPSSALRKAALTAAKKRTHTAFEDFVSEAFRDKAAWTLETITAHEEAKHVAVITHLRSSAKELVAMLRAEGKNVFHIDGDLAASKRSRVVQEAAASSEAVVVCTMHSIGTGLNAFADFDLAVFAELYWRPATVTQTMARFNRLSSTKPSKCILLSFIGTHDERISLSVLDKLNEINTLYKPGSGEATLQKSLMGDEKSDETFFEGLCASILGEHE